MNYITKSSAPKQSGIARFTILMASVLVMPLMVAFLALPVKTSALGIPDVTDGLTKVLTMGKSTPAPVYTPAPSNAPSAATTTTTSPTATTTASAPATATTATSSASTSGATNNTTSSQSTANTVSSASTAAKGTGPTDLYKITELTASQHKLTKNVFRSTLIAGGILILIALVISALRFMGRTSKSTANTARRSET